MFFSASGKAEVGEILVLSHSQGICSGLKNDEHFGVLPSVFHGFFYNTRRDSVGRGVFLRHERCEVIIPSRYSNDGDGSTTTHLQEKMERYN